jgi:hypothetical protein
MTDDKRITILCPLVIEVSLEDENCPDSLYICFVAQVYGILSIQLLLTIAVSALTVLHEPTNLYVLSHPVRLAFCTAISW